MFHLSHFRSVTWPRSVNLVQYPYPSRKQVHALVIDTLQAKFVTESGHTEENPRGRFRFLRKRTGLERLDQVKMLISVGTNYEANHMKELLTDCEDIIGENLIDVRRIITGRSGMIPIAILEPTSRGPSPQYGAMRLTLDQCPNAEHFYKTGGMVGRYDHGDIIVAAEAADGEVV